MQEIIDKVIGAGDKFTVIREEAKTIYKSFGTTQCFNYAMDFYKSEHFQVQQLAVFILGHIAPKSSESLSFLKETVSLNSDWKVQEIFAMAFDSYCKETGYENALPVITKWLNSDLIKSEIATWDLSNKKINQVYKLASKFVLPIYTNSK